MWTLQLSEQKHVPKLRINLQTSVKIAYRCDSLLEGFLARFGTRAQFPLCTQEHAVSPLALEGGSPQLALGVPEARGRVSLCRAGLGPLGSVCWHLIQEASEFWR